tara:strand:+ start:85 stop:945 length:861 start_codon:yes stop_codon:yes gene_type:complete
MRVFQRIREAKPPRLYVVADGPKSTEEDEACKAVRKIFERKVDWDCQVEKVYSSTNLGLAKRVQTGLDHVFSKEKKAIILEDDTLPDTSFFGFCDELLEKYEDDHRISHISGCNFQPRASNPDHSYCFCSIYSIWGWATWARSWNYFDLGMKDWKDQEKDNFLDHWFHSRRHKKGMRKMFDLHCNNKDPWTWDYQWVYSCLRNGGLSIMPSSNLVSNIGIGPEGTNTYTAKAVKMFPDKLGKVVKPLKHPQIHRDLGFEKRYYSMEKPPILLSLKNYLKNIVRINS